MKERMISMKTKIADARITALPRKLGDPLPEVWVRFEDQSEKMLFTYYPDEINFVESDFVGLTEDEARTLKFGRDRAYLQSQ
jgi:hypothetical protein